MEIEGLGFGSGRRSGAVDCSGQVGDQNRKMR